MTEKSLALPLLARYAPVVLAFCGAISLWLRPTVWLRQDIRYTNKRINTLETKMDQILGALAVRP